MPELRAPSNPAGTRGVHVEAPPALGALLAQHPELQIDQDAYNINVTANYGTRLSARELFDAYCEHDGNGRSAHLYFHVPLCDYICHFCNYVKRRLAPGPERDSTLDRWVTALIAESSLYLQHAPWVGQARIESFYIGGGTATVLGPAQLLRLLDHVRAHYRLTSDCELTLEGNPDRLHDGALIHAATTMGFNRFSIGVQSLQETVTDFTNRGHSPRMSLDAIAQLNRTGCPYNVDMMFGLPHQSVDSVVDGIETLVELGVPTITIYRFRNADRAAMGIGNRSAWNRSSVRDRLHAKGMFPTLNETYAMRDAIVRVLHDHDYLPSPCGWWSRRGTYPEGNIPRVSRNKWQRVDSLIGFGPGAYGWLDSDRSFLQTHNMTDIAAYLTHMQADAVLPPLAYGRHLEGTQAIAALLGFAFKANQPILLGRFTERFGVDLLRDAPYAAVMGDLLRAGLIDLVDGSQALRPTLRGEALHEEIISVHIHGRIGGYNMEVCHRTPMASK